MNPTRFLFNAAIVAAAGLFAASTAQAGAEKLSSKEVAVEEPFSWTGFYIGGNLGGNWTNYEMGNFFEDVDVNQQLDEFFGPTDIVTSGFGPVTNGGDGFIGIASFLFPGTGPEGSLVDIGTASGFVGGGQLGYNRQFGHFVVGLEGDFERTGTSRSQTFTDTETIYFIPEGFTVTDITATRRIENDWQASARLRVGWANGHVLLYATGGAAWAHINAWANDTARTDIYGFSFFPNPLTNAGPITNGPGFPPSFLLGSISDSNFASADETVMGWTGGGGGEWAINDMVSVGVEYRHSDFEDHTFHFANNGGPIFPGPMKTNLDSDQVTVRFNILLSHFFGR